MTSTLSAMPMMSLALSLRRQAATLVANRSVRCFCRRSLSVIDTHLDDVSQWSQIAGRATMMTRGVSGRAWRVDDRGQSRPERKAHFTSPLGSRTSPHVVQRSTSFSIRLHMIHHSNQNTHAAHEYMTRDWTDTICINVSALLENFTSANREEHQQRHAGRPN